MSVSTPSIAINGGHIESDVGGFLVMKPGEIAGLLAVHVRSSNVIRSYSLSGQTQ